MLPLRLALLLLATAVAAEPDSVMAVGADGPNLVDEIETDETSSSATATADISTSGTYSLNVALYVKEERCVAPHAFGLHRWARSTARPPNIVYPLRCSCVHPVASSTAQPRRVSRVHQGESGGDAERRAARAPIRLGRVRDRAQHVPLPRAVPGQGRIRSAHASAALQVKFN